jgi:ribonucleotide monophosphatase NagD (HAD superfamily)
MSKATTQRNLAKTTIGKPQRPMMNMAFHELNAAIERDNQSRRERRAIEKLKKRPIGKKGIQ